jgi:hypothetical protein
MKNYIAHHLLNVFDVVPIATSVPPSGVSLDVVGVTLISHCVIDNTFIGYDYSRHFAVSINLNIVLNIE